jgi:hypothetical protein
MQIGKPLRTIIVEPLESPVPATATPDPEPEPRQPVAQRHDPEPEPVHEPVAP